MGVCISEQLVTFLYSILLGAVLALLYDLLHPFRTLGGQGWNTLLDAAVAALSAASLFLFVMAGSGELRLFILGGALGGAVLFFCLLSTPLRPIWAFWADIALFPLEVGKKILKKLWKTCKKLFSFWKKWFTIICTKWGGMHRRPKGGEETMAKAPKTKKKRPSSRLTALVLAILLLGIGIQLGGMLDQIRSAEAEEAVYAQRLADLQESNARLAAEIENSDDPELVENIARNELGMTAPGEKVFRFGS